MDKLKNVLATLKKYHFWVLCGVVLFVALASWFQATGKLSGRYDTRVSTLDKLLLDVRRITDHLDHPNEHVNAELQKKTRDLTEVVYATWEYLYQEQSSNNQLPEDLPEDFKREFRNLKPGEKLDETYLEYYQNFIKGHFPKLFDTIDLVRPKEPVEGEPGERPGTRRPRNPIRPVAQFGEGLEFEGEMGPRRGPRGIGQSPSDVETTGIVEWDEADRESLLDRFRWQTPPNTLQVVLAQEDLWVYEALLHVIKDTNAGADESRRFEAPVLRIDSLLIGQEAVAAWEKASGTVFQLTGGTAPSRGPAGTAPAVGEGGGEMMGPKGPGMAGTMGGASTGLLSGRYVDKKGNPLQVGQDGKVPHPFSEFKMMPVQMGLVIAQKSIPTLLVHCANSNMPIEVTRMRINPEMGETVQLHAGAPAAGGEGGPGTEVPSAGLTRRPAAGGMPFGEPMGKHRPARGAGRTTGGAGAEQESHKYVNAELQGIIYIYNDPKHTPFATGTASEPSGGSPDAAASPARETAPAAPAVEPSPAPAEPAVVPGPAAQPDDGAPLGAPRGPGAAPSAETAPAGPGAGAAPGGGPAPARPPGGGMIAPPAGDGAGPGPGGPQPLDAPRTAPGQDTPPGP
jgi:hypothetical protein